MDYKNKTMLSIKYKCIYAEMVWQIKKPTTNCGFYNIFSGTVMF